MGTGVLRLAVVIVGFALAGGGVAYAGTRTGALPTVVRADGPTMAEVAAAGQAAVTNLRADQGDLDRTDLDRADLEQVEQQADGARIDLDESTLQLREATVALEATEAGLAVSRARLAEVRGRLLVARAKDRAAAVRLAEARREVDRARSELAAAKRKVREQRAQIGSFARMMYQQRTVDDITAILGSGSARELVDRMQYACSIGDSQTAQLDRLKALRAEVAVRRSELDSAELRAERSKAEAAANLARVRHLERAATAAEAEQSQLVTKLAAARAVAADAAAEDRRRYNTLVAERRRVERLLVELAREEAKHARRAMIDAAARNEPGSFDGDSDDAGGPLSAPVKASITSPYGMRLHPVLRVRKLHDGTDFGAPCGTRVRAAAPGRVVSAYYNSAYGNRVLVSHGRIEGKSTVTAYNHLSEFIVGKGDQVARGETVGYVGSTGYSTGCHLHFMVLRDGRTVDPMDWL